MRYYVPDYKLEEEEVKAVYTCDICDDEIYEEEIYYRLDHVLVCEECGNQSRRVASREDFR